MLEYGFAPRFVLTYEDTSKLKNTSLEFMYSTHYETWIDEAAKIYNDTAACCGLRKLRMVEHGSTNRCLRDEIEDGTSLIVNIRRNGKSTVLIVEAGGYAVREAVL